MNINIYFVIAYMNIKEKYITQIINIEQHSLKVNVDPNDVINQ